LPYCETIAATRGPLSCSPESSSFPALSFSIRAGPDATPAPEDFLRNAKAFFGERRRALSIRIRSHADADLSKACDAIALPRVVDNAGMVLDAPPAAAAAPGAGVELRTVAREQDASDYGNVVAESYATAGLRGESAALQFGIGDGHGPGKFTSRTARTDA
jgi:hypothetical protein